ncbi:hypothetical protein WOLCODRAFT_164171 [Wolfiporia cocos MD-104 SS10]|uniref:Uncharacterized protein n=1 Tax=Wolfiporia cocos (strain MD-104) TaxID=742152 RepID=A0A2H3JLD2_WOLCO|nr:hypothetical protein WOLCODRAFT_164171 [Wolfiporia cocos MD-104 SS10]
MTCARAVRRYCEPSGRTARRRDRARAAVRAQEPAASHTRIPRSRRARGPCVRRPRDPAPAVGVPAHAHAHTYRHRHTHTPACHRAPGAIGPGPGPGPSARAGTVSQSARATEPPRARSRGGTDAGRRPRGGLAEGKMRVVDLRNVRKGAAPGSVARARSCRKRRESGISDRTRAPSDVCGRWPQTRTYMRCVPHRVAPAHAPHSIIRACRPCRWTDLGSRILRHRGGLILSELDPATPHGETRVWRVWRVRHRVLWLRCAYVRGRAPKAEEQRRPVIKPSHPDHDPGRARAPRARAAYAHIWAVSRASWSEMRALVSRIANQDGARWISARARRRAATIRNCPASPF